MKIAVVGCGAVGSYYGAKLCRAGQDVHFLLRSDYDVVRCNGVLIRSFQGDFTVQPRCANRPEDIGASDLVFVALKTTANDEFARLLPPLVGQKTAVLTLQNGLGNEEQLARLFPVGQIMGGLCFVCLRRVEPGVIRHTDHGQIVIGEFQRPATARTHEFAAMFREAGVPCEVTDTLAQAHWEKLVWNVPFNGLGVAGVVGHEAVVRGELPKDKGRISVSCLPTDKLLADPHWTQLLRELMNEIIATANALGMPVSPELAGRLFALTRTMGAYKASTLLDFERGLPLELESLFLEPLRRANQAGVRTPRLENLCRILCALNAK